MIFTEPQFAYPAAACVCALVGAVTDVQSRRVPNWLTGPAIVAGLALHLAVGGWHDMLFALGAGLACGVIFLVFYLAGGMGAGDVKLMTAVGILGGSHNAASMLVLTALCGGVMAVGLAVARGRLRETLGNVVALTKHHREEGLTPHPEIHVRNAATLRLPYALAIAAGCCITFFLQGGPR